MTNDQSASTNVNTETDVVDYAAKKRRIIRMLLAYSAIFGVICVFLPEEDGPLDLVAALPMLIMGMSWCFTDAGQHDHRIGRLMKVTLVLLFIIGFPLYNFQTHGIHGFKILALTVLLAVAMFACAFSTMFATLYVGDALGLVKNPTSAAFTRTSCDPFSDPFDDDQLQSIIPHLNQFSDFHMLHIPRSPVTTSGMSHPKDLHNLDELHLTDTQVSDAGLEILAEIKSLKRVHIKGTAVTPKGVASFQTALPNCEVIWDGV